MIYVNQKLMLLNKKLEMKVMMTVKERENLIILAIMAVGTIAAL